jgi:hypothetical protein
MKRIFLFLLLLSSGIFFIHAENITIAGVNFDSETLVAQYVGPGVHYIKKRYTKSTESPIVAYFLEVDMENPYIRLEAVLAHDSVRTTERVSSMAIRKSKPGYVYFAGVNADFFTSVGRPANGTVIEGQIGTLPRTGPHLAIVANQPVLDKVSFSGSVVFDRIRRYFHNVNNTRGGNNLIFYNQWNGTTTHTNSSGTEVLLQLLPGEEWGFNKNISAKVIKTEANKGNMVIPANHAVLSGNGTAATYLSGMSAGDEVKLNLDMTFDLFGTPDVYALLGAQPEGMILNEGIPFEIWDELHPRTAVGYSQNRKKLFFCIVDGRSQLSRGVTTEELGDIIKSVGARYAINFDGGGSSAMYIKELGGIVNVPSDGNERSVGDAIYVVASDEPYLAIPEIPKEQEEIVVYPNPAGDVLTVMGKTAVKQLEIISLFGNVVAHTTTDQLSVQIPVGNLAAGVYIVKVKTEKGIVTRKFIKNGLTL